MFSGNYRDLRKLAGSLLSRERSYTLSPTVLVHEAYIRLRPQYKPDWANRDQLVALASRVMRRVILDSARARKASKRSKGENTHVSADTVATDESLFARRRQQQESEAVVAALDLLAQRDPALAELVELRVLGGASASEAARILGRTEDQIRRDWTLARAWLGYRLKATA
jgi:RNA polymerase sigma factor (TIGR02999 family)